MNLQEYKNEFTSMDFKEPAPGVLEVILSSGGTKNPQPMNPMNATMHNETAYIWRKIDLDKSVNCVLLRAQGKAFSVGGDFELVSSMIKDDQALLNVWKECKDMVYNVINCSKPIVSAIHGPAVGSGLALALLADISITAKTAKLIDSHTKLGVAAGDFSAIIWPLLCGMAKAKYYLLTCKSISGEEAERIGLVSMCVEDDDLYSSALSCAVSVAQNSPSAVRFTKHALNNWLRTMGPSFDHSLALEILGFRMPDIQEGLNAMQEKRSPEFEKNCPI